MIKMVLHRVFEVNGEAFKVPEYAKDLREWMAVCCVGITQAMAGGDEEKLRALADEVRRLRKVLDNCRTDLTATTRTAASSGPEVTHLRPVRW